MPCKYIYSAPLLPVVRCIVLGVRAGGVLRGHKKRLAVRVCDGSKHYSYWVRIGCLAQLPGKSNTRSKCMPQTMPVTQSGPVLSHRASSFKHNPLTFHPKVSCSRRRQVLCVKELRLWGGILKCHAISIIYVQVLH